jgi:hypothetical protein
VRAAIAAFLLGVTAVHADTVRVHGSATLAKALQAAAPAIKERLGADLKLDTQAGSSGLFGGSLLYGGRTGSVSYLAEAGYTSREGLALPKGAALAFNQADDGLRTNSDLRTLNLYLRAENEFSKSSEAGLSVFYTDAEKGVAPEGHIEGARFWRYPTWRGLTVALNSETNFGGRVAREAFGVAREAERVARDPEIVAVTTLGALRPAPARRARAGEGRGRDVPRRARRSGGRERTDAGQ